MRAQSQNPVLRVLRLRSLLALNAVALALLGAAFAREWVRNREIRAQIAGLEGQTRQLEARNLEIAELATMLQSESAIEREARLKLGLRKAGESAVVVRRDAPAPRPERASAPAALASAPNPSKWWAYFFDQPQYRALAKK